MKKVILLFLALAINSCVVIRHDCTCKPVNSNFFESTNAQKLEIKDNPNILLMRSGTTILSDSLIKKIINKKIINK